MSKESFPSGRGYSIGWHSLRCELGAGTNALAHLARFVASASSTLFLNVQGTRPLRNILSKPEYAIPPHNPSGLWNEGRRFLTSWSSFQMYESLTAVSYGDMSTAPDVSAPSSTFSALYAVSAARIPDFIALCVPLIYLISRNPWHRLAFGTLRNPAEHPSKAPPGKCSLGIDCSPPSFNARAPYAILSPPSNMFAKNG